jgi:hypothetical protein
MSVTQNFHLRGACSTEESHRHPNAVFLHFVGFYQRIKRYLRKRETSPSYFDGCWTGRFIVVTPGEWIRNSLFAQVGKLPPLEEVTHILPPVVPSAILPQVINQ